MTIVISEVDHLLSSHVIKVIEYIDSDHGLGNLTVGHDCMCLSVDTRVWRMLHLERLRRP